MLKMFVRVNYMDSPPTKVDSVVTRERWGLEAEVGESGHDLTAMQREASTLISLEQQAILSLSCSSAMFAVSKNTSDCVIVSQVSPSAINSSSEELTSFIKLPPTQANVDAILLFNGKDADAITLSVLKRFMVKPRMILPWIFPDSIFSLNHHEERSDRVTHIQHFKPTEPYFLQSPRDPIRIQGTKVFVADEAMKFTAMDTQLAQAPETLKMKVFLPIDFVNKTDPVEAVVDQINKVKQKLDDVAENIRRVARQRKESVYMDEGISPTKSLREVIHESKAEVPPETQLESTDTKPPFEPKKRSVQFTEVTLCGGGTLPTVAALKKAMKRKNSTSQSEVDMLEVVVPENRSWPSIKEQGDACLLVAQAMHAKARKQGP